MTIRKRILLLMLSGTAIGAACSTTTRVGGRLETRRPSRSSNVLSGIEIQERAGGAPSALAAIELLRPAWGRRLGRTSGQGQMEIKVYVDNVLRGTKEFLDSYPIDQVYELRFFGAREATARWGTGHTLGAFEVISGSPGLPSGVAAQPSTEQRGESSSTFEPPDPFETSMEFFVNSGSALLRTPVEVSEVWEPSVNLGAGFGFRATRTFTVYGSVEYNRFDFSEIGTLAYFSNQDLRALKSMDGVEVVGSPATILNVTGNIKVQTKSGVVRPFLTGGVGYARFDAGAFRLSGPDGTPLPREQFALGVANGGGQTENSFSMSGGAGFEVKTIDRWWLFGDVRYITLIRGPRYRDAYGRNQLFNTSFYPFRVGVTFH